MPDNLESENGSEALDPDASTFADVTSGIYRRFDANAVWTALRYAVRHQLIAKNPTIMLMFVRIAEVYPAARSLLKDHQCQTTGHERQAIDLVLDPPDEIRDAGYLPEKIESPGEMDLCWSEFLVTGKTDVVQRILSVLDRDDLTRRFIPSQLSDEAAEFDLNDAERMELQQVGIGIGRMAEDHDWQMMTPGDTDLFLWLGVKDRRPTCVKILQAMDDPTQLHVATKGAALWSLQANANQHGTIRLFCDEASKAAGGFGRQLLTVS